MSENSERSEFEQIFKTPPENHLKCANILILLQRFVPKSKSNKFEIKYVGFFF